MATHRNLIQATISNTPGTSGNFTISAASLEYLSFAAGDDGLSFNVMISEAGVGKEVRSGCVYTHSGTTLTRGTLESSTAGAALNFTAAAVVHVVASAATLNTIGDMVTLAGTSGTTMTFPPASAEIGYLNIPQNSKSADYTLVAADSGKHIFHPSADTTPRTITIPANSSVAFPVGTAITFVNQDGAGDLTIAITTDTMRLAGAGTTGSRTLAENGVATALKITATEWIISGTGLT